MNRYSVLLNVLLLFTWPIIKAQTPQLWGMTQNGGSISKSETGEGVVFKINEDGSGYDTIHSFNYIQGDSATGSLLLGSDGMLYGMTPKGGDSSRNDGVIFSINPSTNAFSELFHFESFNGANPYGSLIEYNGVLYGMTRYGGKYSKGVIFSFVPSSGVYTDLHDFNISNGANPYFGNLILANNKFYGMTEYGGNGTPAVGVIFSFDPSSNAYNVLYDFVDTSGANPYGSLIQAANGKLYGMTHSKASNEYSGTIFSFNPADGTYQTEYNFPYAPYANPYGSLTQVNDSLLYGMTYGGGVNYVGNIFSFNINNNTITDLYDFNDVSSPFCAGAYGNLLLVNNRLYGMTQGGTDGVGNIFSFDLGNNACNDLYDFNGKSGGVPYGSLIEVTTTGIEHLTGDNYIVSVYPNPASNQLSVNSNKGINKVEIANILGQNVLKKTFNTQLNRLTVNINALSPGIYFITISSGKEITTKKIVVTR